MEAMFPYFEHSKPGCAAFMPEENHGLVWNSWVALSCRRGAMGFTSPSVESCCTTAPVMTHSSWRQACWTQVVFNLILHVPALGTDTGQGMQRTLQLFLSRRLSTAFCLHLYGSRVVPTNKTKDAWRLP